MGKNAEKKASNGQTIGGVKLPHLVPDLVLSDWKLKCQGLNNRKQMGFFPFENRSESEDSRYF